MTRRLPHRLSALVAAAFFLLSWGGEALGQHGCPHHSGVPGQAAHAEDASQGHAEHHAAAEDGHHAPSPVPADGHQSCTCQGTCPSAAGVALPAAPKDGIPVAAERADASLGAAPQAAVALRIPFFLPYSQAPPLVG